MSALAQAMTRARAAAGLSMERFAALLQLSASTVQAWEDDRAPVPPEQLDAIARLFGLDIPQFMTADFTASPAALLFRSIADADASSLDGLAAVRAPHLLGEFLRCVRIEDECERLAGAEASWSWLDAFPAVPVDPESRAPHGAEELAARARELLGLGEAPIASMRKLLEVRLGVSLFFVTPEELSPTIDAACVSFPRPAILVNVVAGGEKWWRTRMSLAHELAHLLLDRDVLHAPRRLFLLSPAERAPQAWRLTEHFEAMERRASAFAAYFLAPPAAVRALVRPEEAATARALRAVARHFMVGQETAANVLTNVFRLPELERARLLNLEPGLDLPRDHDDRVPRGGLRNKRFVARVMRAYAGGKIDGVRARRWLKIPATEPLPHAGGVREQLRRPLLSLTDRAALGLETRLRELVHDPAVFVESVRRRADGTMVASVARAHEDGGFDDLGEVVLAADLRVIEAPTSAPLDALLSR